MIPRCTCSRYCARELRDGLPVPRKRRHQVIRIPDWVPQPVGQLARNMYQNAQKNGHKITLLRRLTTDTRMKKVWAGLRPTPRSAPCQSAQQDQTWQEQARHASPICRICPVIGGPDRSRDRSDVSANAGNNRTKT